MSFLLSPRSLAAWQPTELSPMQPSPTPVHPHVPDVRASSRGTVHHPTGRSLVTYWKSARTEDRFAIVRASFILFLAGIASAADAEPSDPSVTPLAPLIDEALAHNPELIASRAAHDAAVQRERPAAALDDPMLEVGVVNAPVPSLSFRRDDMTMKMLGISQRLPYPGKRALRGQVAAADSRSISSAVEEATNRVIRDVRVAYEDLRFARTTESIIKSTQKTMRDLVTVSAARFALGEAAQSDVLKAQTEVVQLQLDLLRTRQDVAARQAELRRLLGRPAADDAIAPTSATLTELRADAGSLRRDALDRRPQIRALDALVEKNDRELELARREYFPDIELRVGYGQRDRTFDGMRRDDMITMTVEVNLPIWRKSRLEPRVAEARAMRREAEAMASAQRLETQANLEQQLALERQSWESAGLYRTTLLPQTRAVVQSTLNAYRVGRVDFLTVLDAQIRVFETEKGEADAIATHNRTMAEIDFLTGATPETIQGVQP